MLAADLLGIGETDSGNRDYQNPFQAFWIETSIPGIRAIQISRCVEFVQNLPCAEKNQIQAIGTGAAATALLHCAAYNEDISKVALIDALSTYERFVMNRYYNVDANALVPAALNDYDLPDLVCLIAPRPVLILGARDHKNNMLSKEEVETDLQFAKKCFTTKQAEKALSISQTSETDRNELLVQWLSWDR